MKNMLPLIVLSTLFIPAVRLSADDEAEIAGKTGDATDRAEVERRFARKYFLSESQVLRHIPVPAGDKLRQQWLDTIFPDRGTTRPPTTLYLIWKNGKPNWHGGTFGGQRGVRLKSLLPMLRLVSKPWIDGDEQLLEMLIEGDWLIAADADRNEALAAIERVLRDHWKKPVRLQFRTVERDVCVVRGNWDFHPISDKFPNVQIYGDYIREDSGAGGGSGDFKTFLTAVGSWIELPVIDEAGSGPEDEISWRFHAASPFTDEELKRAHDPGQVTTNLMIQTGLQFEKETRPCEILFVTLEPETDK
ncbi:MAG: hypothetical protein Fues2KO_41750 [Fuerstiella sp.]